MDIFSKDFLLIPIHDALHWSLIIVCHPGLDFDSGDRRPYILHLDSMEGEQLLIACSIMTGSAAPNGHPPHMLLSCMNCNLACIWRNLCQPCTFGTIPFFECYLYLSLSQSCARPHVALHCSQIFWRLPALLCHLLQRKPCACFVHLLDAHTSGIGVRRLASNFDYHVDATNPNACCHLP